MGGGVRNIFYHQLPFYKDIVVNGRRFIIAHANIPYTMVNADGTLKSDSELSDIEKVDSVLSRSLQSFNAIPGAILVHGHNPTVFEDSFRSDEFTEEMKTLGIDIMWIVGLYMKICQDIDWLH